MKRLLLATTLIVLGLVSPASAQWGPPTTNLWGFPCGCAIESNLDTPGMYSTISVSSGFIGGWGFLETAGVPPSLWTGVDRVQVARIDANGIGTELGVHSDGSVNYAVRLARPDVQAAFGSDPNTGWMWFSWGTLGLGWNHLQITLWHGPLYQTYDWWVYGTP